MTHIIQAKAYAIFYSSQVLSGQVCQLGIGLTDFDWPGARSQKVKNNGAAIGQQRCLEL